MRAAMKVEGSHARQFSRFLVNGLAAACVHFALLVFNLQVLGMQSAGLANLLAAVGGITASFFGNRIFVFPASRQPLLAQAARFGALYAATAAMHGFVLYLWTDVSHRDYRSGFILATGLQVVLSYFGNRFLVFRP